ncbi:MAG TPA: hypothetical protein PK604_09475 [Acetivibrio clariflavus]|nr:hypothetical protein [Acetivibrio clariflavus]
MVCDDTKRVVIIRNISSNIVEEAILVLKDKKPSKNKNAVISTTNNSKKANNYLLREAEDIINNYIKENNIRDGLIHDLNLKPFNPNKKLINTLINFALVASIALLLFIISKFFLEK